ncbi:hypothetical protein AV903_07440 [Erwinia tracheiphila]|uniref:Transposase n=1 Tax=Erwinia tracheiphila TaxID=65700 RepID=A0A345CR59_9GAMM|nr:hypothetical protein AV903_07440 [Erwinia tracheiphila]
MSKVFTAEFKLEAAKRVLDQHYTHGEAAKAMNVSLSAINRWVKSLRLQRQGKKHRCCLSLLSKLNSGK